MGAVLSKLAGQNYSTIGVNMMGMAVAMTLLVIPIKTLGSMDLGSLAKGIVAFGVALGLLVGAAYLLAPLATSLSVLSKAMIAFGAACLGVGVLVGAICDISHSWCSWRGCDSRCYCWLDSGIPCDDAAYR